MNEKVFALVFIVVTILAVLVIVFSRNFLSPDSQIPFESPTPQPTLTPTESSEATQSAQTQQTRKKYSSPFPDLSPSELKNKKAVIETAKGNIEFEIYPEASRAATNFISLANDKFYNGLTFHRVEPGFVIQGGDPIGNGSGGPGYTFQDEPVTKKYLKGTVAMANAGPNTNGSQFFIMLEDNLNLPPKYTIFGKVIKGQNVVDKIVVGDVMTKVSIASLK